MEYFTTKEILCGLGSGVFSSLLAVGLCYKLAPKYRILHQKYYSDIFLVTYKYKPNGMKDKIITTCTVKLPNANEVDEKDIIKLDANHRVLPQHRGRFVGWCKYHITKHRQQNELKIDDYEAIENVVPTFTLTNPYKADSEIAEQQREIERKRGYDDKILPFEIDITEEDEIIRTIEDGEPE